jgi:hypothetical protein
MTAPAAAPIAASRLVFFFMVVVPDDVDAVDPLDPDVPLVRRAVDVDLRAGAGATGVCKAAA